MGKQYLPCLCLQAAGQSGKALWGGHECRASQQRLLVVCCSSEPRGHSESMCPFQKSQRPLWLPRQAGQPAPGLTSSQEASLSFLSAVFFPKVLGDSQQDASVSQMAKSHTQRHKEIHTYIYRQTQENTDGHTQTHAVTYRQRHRTDVQRTGDWAQVGTFLPSQPHPQPLKQHQGCESTFVR